MMKFIVGILTMSLFLIGCSHSPVQSVLSSNPDDFATAVNMNFSDDTVGDCARYYVNPSYYQSGFTNEARAIYGSEPTYRHHCHILFTTMAGVLNANTSYKNLTASDLENKAVWEHYFQSKYAKWTNH